MSMIRTAAFSRIAPFALYILLLIADRPFSEWLSQAGMDLRWLYAARAGLVALVLVYFWRNYSELLATAEVSVKAWLVALCVGLLVFLIWILPYPAWARLDGQDAPFDPWRQGGELEYLFLAIRIGSAALVVPLMEELFWRSFLMRWLQDPDFLAVDPARVGLWPFLITTVLFAVEHDLCLAGLVAGVAYGWLYTVTRNLWMPLAAHAVTNGALGAWVVYTDAWEYW